MDLSQGLDLDCTEAEVKVERSVLSGTMLHKQLLKTFLEIAALPLIGVDHKLEEVCVLLYDVQWDHLCNIGVPVPELVQFQVDFEHVLSDCLRTWF